MFQSNWKVSKIQESLRYFINLSFNGKHYHGWQIQPDAISVQEVLEDKLSTLLRSEIKVVGAGRTDTGVHASGMVAHFDIDEAIENVEETIHRLNSFLPADIAVSTMYPVLEEAHARFDAVEREYQYRVILKKDPFIKELAYHIHNVPDVEAMNKAANLLLGHQDFQCFSRSNTDVKTYYCDIKYAQWEMVDDSLLNFTIRADRFLRNMVRAIVGTLLDVGFDKTDISALKEIIDSKDRSKAGASAPAHGLFLTQVVYRDHIKE